mmetsp:Transcript_21115/g.69689  ORF Transcript_21115/g.69689 Transcript_21115/m.69689 type:complete len:262 (+) Transcript_21115:3744-4529(+)
MMRIAVLILQPSTGTERLRACDGRPAREASSLLGSVGPVEDAQRGPCHRDAVCALVPLDEEVSARQAHGGGALGAPLEHGGDEEGAGAGAARERGAGAALPHLHPQVRPRENLHKLDVALSREGRVALERGPDRLEVERVEVVDEDGGVRVAHRHARRAEVSARRRDGRRHHHAVVVDGKRRRHRRAVEDGLAHVHLDGAVGQQGGTDRPGERIDRVRRLDLLQRREEAREAADAVAAHLGLRPVRVVDAHGAHRLGLLRR